MPGPIGIRAQQAVCAEDCTLAPELRHLVMVLAVLANRRTGEGIAGQERIAGAMGVTTRTVRRLLAELADADAPVAVMRTPRMRRTGRGRTSDAYTLAVQADTGDRLNDDDQPDACVQVDMGEQADADDHKVTHDQPDTLARPTGHAEHDQPDAHVRASDPGRDPRSDPRSTSARCAVGGAAFSLSPEPEPAKVAARRRAPKKADRKRTDAEVAGHREILDAYVSAVESKTRQKPAIGSREASAAWKLLDWTKGESAQAVTLVRAAVARDFGGSTSLVIIAGDPNKFLGGNPSNGKRNGPVQPNGGAWKPVVERLG
ncbi:MAG: hypothetical protein IPM35_02640 [Myxococcales bacterium]|nr:hypothetical protein [Myxococcales bacterium]